MIAPRRSLFHRQDRKLRIRNSAPGILERPLDDPQETNYGRWTVTVFNNETNTYEEVVAILIEATGCSVEEAVIETWEIDHLGLSVVHQARQEECETVARVIATIGIRVEVEPPI